MSSRNATTLAVASSSVTSAPSNAAAMSRPNAGPPVTWAVRPPVTPPSACRIASTAADCVSVSPVSGTASSTAWPSADGTGGET